MVGAPLVRNPVSPWPIPRGGHGAWVEFHRAGTNSRRSEHPESEAIFYPLIDSVGRESEDHEGAFVEVSNLYACIKSMDEEIVFFAAALPNKLYARLFCRYHDTLSGA